MTSYNELWQTLVLIQAKPMRAIKLLCDQIVQANVSCSKVKIILLVKQYDVIERIANSKTLELILDRPIPLSIDILNAEANDEFYELLIRAITIVYSSAQQLIPFATYVFKLLEIISHALFTK